MSEDSKILEGETVRAERSSPSSLDIAGVLVSPDAGAVHYPGAGSEISYRLMYSVVGALMLAESLDDGLREFLAKSCQGLHADYGALWLSLPRGSMLRCEAAWHAGAPGLQTLAVISRAVTYAPGTAIPGRVWATGAAEWVDDLATEYDIAHPTVGG